MQIDIGAPILFAWESRSWLGFEWSSWIPLDAPLQAFQEHITTELGFYRVKVYSKARLSYIGQTGRSLRERTRSSSMNTYRPQHVPRQQS